MARFCLGNMENKLCSVNAAGWLRSVKPSPPWMTCWCRQKVKGSVLVLEDGTGKPHVVSTKDEHGKWTDAEEEERPY